MRGAEGDKCGEHALHKFCGRQVVQRSIDECPELAAEPPSIRHTFGWAPGTAPRYLCDLRRTVVITLTRRRGARGAAAVEFALVMPILFLVMFGILQYGLYFNDSLNTRQGVREGARLGVVQSFTETGCSGNELQKLACRTVKRIDALTGTAYVKVSAATPWVKGQPLTVCAWVRTETPGLLPMPNDGWIFSKTQMSIESTSTTPAAATGTSSPALPVGSGIPTWPTGC